MAASIIYGLADPTSGDIRYVGQTKNSRRRYWMHCSPSNNRSSRKLALWLRALFKQGLKPTWVELETANDGDACEKAWVERLTADGAILLNMNAGGKSVDHLARAPSANIRGKKMPPLHQLRKQLTQAANGLRRDWHEAAADRVAARCRDVDHAIARLEKKLGRQQAHAFINERLKRKHLQRVSY